MHAGPRDVAQVRLDNALVLFEEFVHATVKHPDAATLRGLEGRFAERLQIHPSYWSQIKSRSRQIGERLARQFEQLCHKPVGWMDVPHEAGSSRPAGSAPSQPPRPRRARCRRTTTSASSSAWCSRTTGAIRSAPARASWNCSARC
ncbi:hypothetical protein ACPWT1_20060 [Ramlibacter sp. MMS24-I3-19]|uniref:hypothetical protein n=1 Tax=Ramlibacter sp. MMS24-I3-19 TaxID=3416606 RepID=UPI003D036D9A